MKMCESLSPLLPVVLVAAVVVLVALAALADGFGLHALAHDRRLLLLGGVPRGVGRGHEVATGRVWKQYLKGTVHLKCMSSKSRRQYLVLFLNLHF